jgi:septum formation protein
MEPLLLASTSPYRRELLARLECPFEAVAPEYEEARVSGLSARELALCHALGKARSVAAHSPGRIVIGSDQVGELDGDILGKPGDPEAAVSQLLRMAGRPVAFHTGLAVVRDEQEETALETYTVRLRELSREEVEEYVRADRPLGCAGGFRIESRGIALMEELRGRDYTALIGLPLIALIDLLTRFGVHVLSRRSAAFTRDGTCS